MNKHAIWWRWAVFLGVFQDWFFAIPGMFEPNAVLAFAGAEQAFAQPVWPAFACLVLLLLSLLYIPSALDPFHYLPHALLTVLARAAGVVFFFVLYPGRFPVLLGAIDLTLTILQGTLLFLTLRAGSDQFVNRVERGHQ